MQPPESASPPIGASRKLSIYLVWSTTLPCQSDRLASLNVLRPGRKDERVIGVGDSKEGSRDSEDVGEMHGDL